MRIQGPALAVLVSGNTVVSGRQIIFEGVSATVGRGAK